MAGYVSSELYGFGSKVKPVLSGHSKRSKLVFKTDYDLSLKKIQIGFQDRL